MTFSYPSEGDSYAAHVKRTGSLDSAFEVGWETTVRGSVTPRKDFAIRGGVLRFAPGYVQETVSIPVLDDGLSELPETIELRLVTASNVVVIGEPLSTTTVIDNEIPPTLDPAFLNLRGRAAPGIARSCFAAARPDGGAVDPEFFQTQFDVAEFPGADDFAALELS